MKPRLLTILLLLLVGTVVNVGVAWGCAYWSDTESGGSVQGGYRGGWYVEISQTAGKISLIRSAVAGADNGFAVPTWSAANVPATDEEIAVFERTGGQNVSLLIVEERTGWPLSSMACSYEIALRSTGSLSVPATSFGLLVRFPSGMALPTVLPARPVLPGFVLNLVLYSVVIWLLVRLPAPARRCVRTRYGLCTGCGYPVRASGVCPECGRPLRLRPEEATRTRRQTMELARRIRVYAGIGVAYCLGHIVGWLVPLGIFHVSDLSVGTAPCDLLGQIRVYGLASLLLGAIYASCVAARTRFRAGDSVPRRFLAIVCGMLSLATGTGIPFWFFTHRNSDLIGSIVIWSSLAMALFLAEVSVRLSRTEQRS